MFDILIFLFVIMFWFFNGLKLGFEFRFYFDV